MTSATAAFSSALNLPSNTYIYKILSTTPRTDPYTYTASPDQLAIIASDDSLRFLDPLTLSLVPNGLIKNVHESVTCLERVDDEGSFVVATAGRDGLVKYWDRRTRENVMTVQCPSKLISSIVCNAPRNVLAAGIENPEDGPHESPVYVWDTRNPSTPTLSLIESHTDTITSLQIHPSLPTLLLSSSTDGLINIFDTSKPDEEEALYQVINHGSAVAQAGFLYPSTDIYALGTDETVGFYALQSQDEEEVEPKPTLLGDVREMLGCEYLVKMMGVGEEICIVAGKASDAENSAVDLIPLKKDTKSGEPLSYAFQPRERIRLPGAHGEEIVRDMFTDMHSNTAYTCGEDGQIRAWKLPTAGEATATNSDVPKQNKKDKKDRKEAKKDRKKAKEEKARFKPY